MCANVSTFSSLPTPAWRKVAAFTFCGWCLAPEQQMHSLTEPVVLCASSSLQPWQGTAQPLPVFSPRGFQPGKEPLQTRVVRAVPPPGENKPDSGTLGKGKTLLIPDKPWLSLGLCQSRWSAALTGILWGVLRGDIPTQFPVQPFRKLSLWRGCLQSCCSSRTGPTAPGACVCPGWGRDAFGSPLPAL